MVKADYNDRESLLMAVTGAYGCFAVTNFFETMSKAKEAEQVRVTHQSINTSITLYTVRFGYVKTQWF